MSTTRPTTAPPTTRTPAANPHMTPTGVWTKQRIRALGAVADLPTAAKIFGLGRALALGLAKDEPLPVPVIRDGTCTIACTSQTTLERGTLSTGEDQDRCPVTRSGSRDRGEADQLSADGMKERGPRSS
jgi:hypothetical protein